MKHIWALLFGVVFLAELGIFLVAPYMGWWIPKNVAILGDEIDGLFNIILALTTFFFILTTVILIFAMYRFETKPGQKAAYTHGNNRLEIFWTVIPAGILIYIAVAQISVWERIKYQSKLPAPDQVVQVTARQWEWRLRYPASRDTNADIALVPDVRADWGERSQATDLHIPNELHTWKDANLKVYLKTQDVIHSFFLPNLRFKQDALPGKTMTFWLNVKESNTEFDEKTGLCTEPKDKRDAWEIACAELCGAGHARMRGRLYVHKNKEDYLKWRDHAFKLQQETDATKTTLAPKAANGG